MEKEKTKGKVKSNAVVVNAPDCATAWLHDEMM